MSVRQLPQRDKIVPQLYEEDASRYAGPHPLQQTGVARLIRRKLKHHAYLRWADVFTEMAVTGREHLSPQSGPAIFVANHTLN